MAVRTQSAVAGRGLSRSFGDTVVLSDVDIAIGFGEVVALIGGSGSGKSTLLRILAGLDPDAGGVVDRVGRSAVVFQEHRLLPWKRVADNVALGVRGSRGRVLEALAEVELEDRAQAWPAELSGGQAQRVAFARALVREPDLLLLDEPFGALDALTRLKMQALFGRLKAKHGFGALFVTHDVDEALLLADRVLLLEAGGIAEERVVELPAPRGPEDPGFVELRRHLLRRLGV